MITHYNLRFAGYYSARQWALRDDDVYLTVMPAFHIDCQCTAAMAAFSAGPPLCWSRNTAPAPLGTGAEVPRHHYRMYSDDDSYVDGAAAFSQRSATLPAEVMFYLNLVGAGKDAFCERFSVRLLTSYGMTETIVGIIGDRPGDKRRWPSIGRAGFATKRRSATITPSLPGW